MRFTSPSPAIEFVMMSVELADFLVRFAGDFASTLSLPR